MKKYIGSNRCSIRGSCGSARGETWGSGEQVGTSSYGRWQGKEQRPKEVDEKSASSVTSTKIVPHAFTWFKCEENTINKCLILFLILRPL